MSWVNEVYSRNFSASELETMAESVRAMCMEHGLNLVRQPLWKS
jgi:hypothetical protein